MYSFIFWSFLQITFYDQPKLARFNMKRETELDFRNRLVSFCHGLLALTLSAYQVFRVPYTCGDRTTLLEYFILVNSGGYFTYDLVGMKVFGLLKFDMFIHHAMCIAGIVVILLEGHDTCHVVAGLFVAEVSNPSMHVRTMLRNLGMRYTLIHDVAEVGYFFTFFVGRMIMGHPIVYDTIMCSSTHWLGKLVSLGVLGQSYQFLYRMYLLLIARYSET